MGSSPLARGLPQFKVVRERMHRIIPARAGFTIVPRLGRVPAMDHPRSRGVYLASQAHSIQYSGSSPLARGLLTWARCPDSEHGIIPARAGFTSDRGSDKHHG